jgi:hypothetical protein
LRLEARKYPTHAAENEAAFLDAVVVEAAPIVVNFNININRSSNRRLTVIFIIAKQTVEARENTRARRE